MATLDLIYAIAAGASQDAAAEFNAQIADRITTAIDSKRQELAKTMFNTVTAATVEPELEDNKE